MIDEQDSKMSNDGVSRRSFLGKTSAVLVAATSLPIVAAAQQTKDLSGDTHTGGNEQELGPKNRSLETQNPDSMYPPTTDAGGQPPFKYPMGFAKKRIEGGLDTPSDDSRLRAVEENGWRGDASDLGRRA